jgi:hypothetical protein
MFTCTHAPVHSLALFVVSLNSKTMDLGIKLITTKTCQSPEVNHSVPQEGTHGSKEF